VIKGRSNFAPSYPKILLIALAFDLFWFAGIYTFTLFADPKNYDTAWFGRTIVRPANVVLFGIIASFIGFHLKMAWLRHKGD